MRPEFSLRLTLCTRGRKLYKPPASTPNRRPVVKIFRADHPPGAKPKSIREARWGSNRPSDANQHSKPTDGNPWVLGFTFRTACHRLLLSRGIVFSIHAARFLLRPSLPPHQQRHQTRQHLLARPRSDRRRSHLHFQGISGANPPAPRK